MTSDDQNTAPPPVFIPTAPGWRVHVTDPTGRRQYVAPLIGWAPAGEQLRAVWWHAGARHVPEDHNHRWVVEPDPETYRLAVTSGVSDTLMEILTNYPRLTGEILAAMTRGTESAAAAYLDRVGLLGPPATDGPRS